MSMSTIMSIDAITPSLARPDMSLPRPAESTVTGDTLPPMAHATQGPQVRLIVCSASVQRHDVIDLGGRLSLAVLADRVAVEDRQSQPTPACVVAAGRSRR